MQSLGGGRYASAQIAFDVGVSYHEGEGMGNARLMLDGKSDQKSYTCGDLSAASTPHNPCAHGTLFGSDNTMCLCESRCVGVSHCGNAVTRRRSYSSNQPGSCP